MSVLADRAAVGEALFGSLLDPSFEAWLDGCPNVVDDEGDVVMLTFGRYEPIESLIAATRPYSHSVVMGTLIDAEVVAWVLGPSMRADVPSDAEPIRADSGTTVDDLVATLRTLEPGANVVLEFAADRHALALGPA